MTNLLFNPEFGEYLLAAGFKKEVGYIYPHITFTNGSVSVVFHKNEVEFYQYYDYEEDDRAPEWCKFFSVEGTDQLNLQGFQMLCHITGVYTLEQMKADAEQEEFRLQNIERPSAAFDLASRISRAHAAAAFNMETMCRSILFPNYQKATV